MASSASASPASLVTTDGIGIRIDETAILGPALEAIEDELQPWVNDRIYQGALENSVMDDPDWVQGSANLELSFDFVNAGTPGYPQGGIKVHADLEDIMMRFYRYGAWWQPECQFRVNPDDGAIDISAYIDTSKLPAAPLTLNPVSASWDDDPAITREVGNFLCTGYLLDEWWDGLWGNGTDIAADLEAELDAVAQDLVDDLWAEYVTPVIESLTGFGITFNQVRTDNDGLIVTADVDATNGVTIPGYEGNGPIDVSTAESSGASSDVNALLANRGEVIVTAHPNVVNQYLHAIRTLLSGNLGQPAIDGPAIEAILLNPGDRASYSDVGWTAKLSTTTSPYTTPAVSNGAPILGFPTVKIQIYHSSNPRTPVATFDGSMGGIGLVTELRSGTADWGPALSTGGLTLSVTRTQANAHAAAVAPQTSAELVPLAQQLVDGFSDGFFVRLLTLAPLNVGGIPVGLCGSCGRYAGDQRYTETFNVG